MSYFKVTCKKKNKMSELISFKDVKKTYVVGEKKIQTLKIKTQKRSSRFNLFKSS